MKRFEHMNAWAHNMISLLQGYVIKRGVLLLISWAFIAQVTIAQTQGDDDTIEFTDSLVHTSQGSIPIIAEGNSGQARDISALFPVIVLFVSGGQDPKYSAKDYAKIFCNLFKDPERSDHPTEIIVRYVESGEARQTGFIVYINDRKFDKDGKVYEGTDGVFNPVQLLNFLPKITEQYARVFGDQ